ncbi:hypothetical protein H6F42_04050 [Pseudanabaena sp. FACHB-1998]|uniref:hypothetical protein n=1 Tax=Pseudanabaena sp. FACHB-1998 TaxID=2692858 RepID=UPI001680E50A|nr:hypothetical protein [Pseudanabaena sp. FACHB-1998]MBD2176092.1 hypothetical protein [Pseudanabaena sp. FACHB-1998]
MKNRVPTLSSHPSKIVLACLSVLSVGGMAMVMPSSAKAAEVTFRLGWSGAAFGFPKVTASGLITFFSLPPNGTASNGGAIAAGTNAVGIGGLNVPKINENQISDPIYNAANPITQYVKSLNVTVTDQSFGTTDSYTLADYDGIIWDANFANFDFSKNLVGQSTKGSLNWGSVVLPDTSTLNSDSIYSKSYTQRGIVGGAYGGDFNLFDDPNCIATGYQPFTLKTCRPNPLSGQRDNQNGALMQLTVFEMVTPTPVPVPGAVFGVIAAGGLLAVSKKKKKAVDSHLTK